MNTIIRTKLLSELSFVELFNAHARIIWAQCQCEVGFGEQFAIHAKSAEAILEEVKRREDSTRRDSAMLVKTNAAPYAENGDRVYA